MVISLWLAHLLITEVPFIPLFVRQFSDWTFMMIAVCIFCRTQMSHMTAALEQKQYQNTALGGQQSQTGNTGMPVPDNKRAKTEDGRNSPPSCRPCWIPLLEFLSCLEEPSGWQNGRVRCGSLSCFCKPRQGVRGKWGLFDNAAFLTP